MSRLRPRPLALAPMEAALSVSSTAFGLNEDLIIGASYNYVYIRDPGPPSRK